MRARIEAALREALASMDLETRVAHALSRAPELRAARAISVVAVGKAAHAMLAGARAALGARICEHVCVGVEDAGHPLPDTRSVRAARACLELAQRAGASGRPLVVLVSGGASALLCAPSRGVTLADKRAVTRGMLRSGAPIQAVNVARKHLSLIKGGGLARAAAPSRVLTLVVSDVIGGAPSDVGSGPSVVDPSSVRAARAALRRYAPRLAALPLARTLGADPSRRLRARVIASPEELARAFALELGARKLPPSQADVEALAGEYIARAKRLAPGAGVVRAAEPSVRLPAPRGSGRGGALARGGRSTHLAALVGPHLPPGVTFAAIATDGVDGTSGTAGAVVDASFARRISHETLERALRRFDTGPLHVAAGSARPGGATGYNLADLHVLARA